jgi:anti-anti-sigma regulatory factor
VPKAGQVLEEEILAIVEPGDPSGPSVDPSGMPDRNRTDPLPALHPPPIYHHLGVWRHEDKTVVRFGDHRILDELTVKKIIDELFAVAVAVKCRDLIVNFTGVLRLSTLMLGKLLLLRKIMVAKGGRLILCEIAPDIECVFVETKLSQILEIVDTEAEALDACKA